MSFIPKPSALSVVPSPEIRSSQLALPSIKDGKSSPRLPVVSPTASGKHSDSSGTPGGLAQLLGGSPRRARRKSEGRTTATDLPEVSDERSPIAAVKELQKHRERRRSSITFHNDDGISDASPPSPPVSTQMSGKSMKSMTLDDDATASTVHYVKKKKARSVASCSAVDLAKSGKDPKAEKARDREKGEKMEKREKGEKSTSAKNGGGFFGILGGSRTERIEQASDRVRKIDKSPVLVHAESPTARRGSVDDGLREGLGDWTLAIEEPEAEPDMETWQLEERKLQAALERVRMGLSAIEVDPTEEQKREESQLLKDVQEKNYTDREALAYCFVKKLGSLSNAWKYFTRQEKFTKVTWETALLVLHLHVVILTGRNKNEIFQEMSEEDHTVTKESWDTYFAGIDLDGEASCPQTSLSAKEETPSVSLRKRPAASEQDEKQNADKEAAAQAAVLPAPVPAPVSPRRRSSIKAAATVAPEKKLERPEEDPPPSPTKSRKADRRRSSTRRLGSQNSEKFDTTGPVELVEDDEVFLERIDQVLKNISPDCEVFNEGMSRQQKAMLMAKARERNLSAAAWKQGVLVLQEEELSKKLREDVASLSCGLSPVHVPKSLEQFAGVIAEEEGVILTHRKSVDENTIALEMLKESGSNAELQSAAEDFLDSLADGEIRSLALPATSRFRAAVVKAAKDRGLPSATAADGHLQIGNLYLFIQNVDCIIDNLEENQEHDFGSDLHLLQIQLVREKSVKAGLKMAEDQETIKIRRMAALMLGQTGSLEEQRMLTEAAFKKYATGRLGHQIFLRRSDLNQLFVDSPLAEGVRLEDFKGRIGQVYDDTLQLQLDVLGQNYGLSKEYFQVFLTKASNELSWRPKTEVLEAFLEETAGKAEQSTLLT